MLSGLLQKQAFKRSSALGSRGSMLATQTRFFAAPAAGVKIPHNSNLQGMIQWYQENGHTMAKTDPLGLKV